MCVYKNWKDKGMTDIPKLKMVVVKSDTILPHSLILFPKVSIMFFTFLIFQDISVVTETLLEVFKTPSSYT